MKNNQNLGGFTLIELLVVVLIIGILSSVALPQYTKAVEKSRASEAMAYADSWIKGQQIYFMANGTFTDDDSNLDIALPDTLKNFTQFNDSSDGTISLCQLYIGRQNGSVHYSFYVTMSALSDGTYSITRGCYGNEKMCKAISNGAACSHGAGDGDVAWCYGGEDNPTGAGF